MPMSRALLALLGLMVAATAVVVVGLALDQGSAEGNVTVAGAPKAAAVSTTPPKAAPVPTTRSVVSTTTEATTTTRPTTTTSTLAATTTTTTPAPTTTTTGAPKTTTTKAATTTTTQPTTTTEATTTTAAAGGSFNSSYESQFRGSINGLRSTPLASDSSLNSYARNWAKHMAESGNFSHSNIGSVLGPWSTVGENISKGSSVSAMFSGLKASPGHHANMVNESFTHLGVGVWVEANGTIWTAHVFGG